MKCVSFTFVNGLMNSKKKWRVEKKLVRVLKGVITVKFSLHKIPFHMVLHEYISKKIHLFDIAVCLACLCKVIRSSNDQNSSLEVSYLISSQIYYESCISITTFIDLCKKRHRFSAL